jgi:hypothetical protein
MPLVRHGERVAYAFAKTIQPATPPSTMSTIKPLPPPMKKPTMQNSHRLSAYLH